MVPNKFSPDCKHWIGYRPCKVQKMIDRPNCLNCDYYMRYSGSALIIEAGGLGSVLRSSVVAKEFKNQGSKVQWLTNKRGVELLKNVSCVDNVFDIEDWRSFLILETQEFDTLVNFESTSIALALTKKIRAKVKHGFQSDSNGNLCLAHLDGLELLRLQTDDIGVFLTNAPNLKCFGKQEYIKHGILGREILEKEGLPKHALVCERHVGVGITQEGIIQENLPLPGRDMLPETIEEKIICIADNFFSKDGEYITKEKPISLIKSLYEKISPEHVRRLENLLQELCIE